MQYRIDPRTGNKLSALGYGCMRFSKRGGVTLQDKAEQEMAYAIEHGVNYFDTAYTYPGNEIALGKFLAKGNRDKLYLATKLPHYMIDNLDDANRIFDEELARLQTDYIDYYLFHMLTNPQSWERLLAMGIVDWIAEKKAKGQIRQIGFSYHGGAEDFRTVLDAYDWDFCQIQFNYMDEHSQAGIGGLNYAASKKIPVIIMEPLRGGRLANKLPKTAEQIFRNANPTRNPAEWGLRWIWNHEAVTCVLSGMNDIAQVKENIRVASDALPNTLTDAELATVDAVKQEINRNTKVGCTGCGYCMPCPHGVDIPTCFRGYNTYYSDGWFTGLKEYFMATTLRKTPTNASLCVRCGACEARCPQQIPIREQLQNVSKTMERLPYKAARLVAKKFRF